MADFPEQFNLTEEQNLKLTQLMSEVDSSNQQQCLYYLQSSGWDIVKAKNKYFEENSGEGIVQSIIYYPYNIISSVFASMASYFKSLFTSDPGQEIKKTVERFKKTYGGRNSPFFVENTFKTAVEIAFRTEKLLFVFIHERSGKNKDTTDFCSNVLKNEVVLEFLDENFVCWMAETDHKDAKMLTKQLHITKQPIIFVFAPVDANRWNRLAFHEGMISVQPLLNSLTDSVQSFDIFIKKRTQRQSAIDETALLRQQQDEDYQRVIEMDMEKKNQEKIEQEKKEKERELEEQKLKKENDLMNEKRAYLKDEPPEHTCGVINFVIVLPNGETIKRRFFENCKIREIYYFIEIQNIELNGVRLNNSEDYTIVTTFPRKSYSELDQTLKEAGFKSRAKIIVEKH